MLFTALLFWFVGFGVCLTLLTVWILRALRFRTLAIIVTAVVELPLLISLPTLIDWVSNSKQCLSRRGRVVDMESARGLPGALVSIKIEYAQPGIFTAGVGDVLFSADTQTDADGYYQFPSLLNRLHLWWPPLFGTEPHIYVYVHAIAPGYVNTEDVYSGPFASSTSWPPGGPVRWPQLSSPTSQLNGFSLVMKDIVMQKKRLDTDAFLIYFASLKDNVAGSAAATGTLNALYQEAVDRVCAQPSDDLVGYFSYSAASKLSKSNAVFVDRVDFLEPVGKLDQHQEPLKQMYERKYTAAHICDALKYSGGAIR